MSYKKRGIVKINKVMPYAPLLHTINSQLLIYGKVVIYGNVLIGCANIIIVTRKATLEMGSYAHITDLCNIGSNKFIKIGDGTTISHRC